MKIVKNDSSLKISFYIKRVGNAGEPSYTPLTANNSWGVVSDNPEIDFQRVMTAYKARAFEVYKRGSVQQFITKRDVETVLSECERMDSVKLDKLAKIQALVDAEERKLNKLKELLEASQKAIFYS